MEQYIPYIIIGGILLIIIMWAIKTHNRLVELKARALKAFQDIDIYLQRRFDLIPNLVETVKGYTKHEKETFEKVVALRSRYSEVPIGDLNEKVKIANEANQAISGMMINLEAYPDLKANTQFTLLQEELQTTENKLAYVRQLYNDWAAKYNIAIAVFPALIIAKMFGFEPLELFKVNNEKVREGVQVKF